MFNSGGWTAQTVYPRQVARVVFGGVLAAGTAVLIRQIVAGLADDGSRARHGGSIYAAQIIGLTWVAAIVGALVAHRLAARRPRGDGGTRLLAWSLVLPSAGLAMLVPLTLHMPIVIGLAGTEGFDGWAELSAMYVGLTHVVLAGLMVRRAYRAARGLAHLSTTQIYVIVVCVSCVPGIILLAIPPALVLVTGIAFPPLMHWGDRLAAAERDLPTVPHAIAL